MSRPLRLDEDVYEWLACHRTSEMMSMSAVIRGTISENNKLQAEIGKLMKELIELKEKNATDVGF